LIFLAIRHGLSSHRAERSTPAVQRADVLAEPGHKKKVRWSLAVEEARAIIRARRGRLSAGLALMLVNRLAGLVLPAASKSLIDEVIGEQRIELLGTIAWAVGAATVVQAVTSFPLSQLLGDAAHKANTDMRRRVEEHDIRMPVPNFDSTHTGVLISHVMNDAYGISNLD
jgi:subfamily B ATP-binding cassette protein MsbA